LISTTTRPVLLFSVSVVFAACCSATSARLRSSWTTAASVQASATRAQYMRIARSESSLPGIT
jgi:hypothetical protein